jgi:hypothetical protein
MTGGIGMNLDEIVKGINKFSRIYEEKSKEGLILINSPIENDNNARKGGYNISGVIISSENRYFEQFLKARAYDSFDQKGYIFVPPGITIERKSQKDIGYGILGTANLSGRVIQILETLYGKDFEEVLMHEALHIQNWDKPEAWVRYETKQRCSFPTRFH